MCESYFTPLDMSGGLHAFLCFIRKLLCGGMKISINTNSTFSVFLCKYHVLNKACMLLNPVHLDQLYH